MKKSTARILQIFIMLFGIAIFAFMLLEPHFEGRNAHATLFEIYFKDAFLAYAYTASIPFFTALYQAFTVLGYTEDRTLFRQKTLRALHIIKYCAFTIIAFIVPAVAYLFIVRPGDDIAGGVFMGLLITTGSLVVVAVAERIEKKYTQ